jgi:hypothetical protein
MPERVIYNVNPIYKAAELAMYERVQWSVDCVIHYWISIHQSNTTQATKFGCTDTNFEIEAPISTWRLSVNDFKRMNNESHIRIALSNLAALLVRANVLVDHTWTTKDSALEIIVRLYIGSVLLYVHDIRWMLIYILPSSLSASVRQ